MISDLQLSSESRSMDEIVIAHGDDWDKDKTIKKIFIPAIGSLGDVQPYLILAKELKKRGYIVWLGVHERFKDQVKAASKNHLFV